MKFKPGDYFGCEEPKIDVNKNDLICELMELRRNLYEYMLKFNDNKFIDESLTDNVLDGAELAFFLEENINDLINTYVEFEKVFINCTNYT